MKYLVLYFLSAMTFIHYSWSFEKLPTADELLIYSINALRNRVLEQTDELEKLKAEELKNKEIEEKIFETNAYLKLKFTNSAPKEYRLNKVIIKLDGKTLSKNRLDNLFKIAPGCHTLEAYVSYTRLKNDLYNRFKVNRTEKHKATQYFIAESGISLEIGIEGFLSQNSLAQFFKTPKVRFNKSAKPNFLPESPIVSMDEILNQGQLKIGFNNEENQDYELLNKSINIDGLVILKDVKHDAKKEILFEAPIIAGKHKLNVLLVYGIKRNIKGGPEYKFNLTFDRDIFVISGQTTIVNLVGMPKNEFIATASSEIVSREDSKYFIDETCKEWQAKKNE